MTDNGKCLQHTKEVMCSNYDRMESACRDKSPKKTDELIRLLMVYINATGRTQSLAEELYCSPDEDDKDIAIEVMFAVQDIRERGEKLIEFLKDEQERG